MGSALHSTVLAAAVLCSRLACAASVCCLTSIVIAQAPETQEAGPTWVYWPDGARAITATEVTVQQYTACVEAGRCDPAHHQDCNIADRTRSDHPMNCVDYFGAQQYCAYVGGRLCTEVEWLEACKGTEDRAFPYGDAFDPRACNVQSTASGIDGDPPSSVPVASDLSCEGGFAGLYDMAGNVFEWLADCQDTYCKFRGGGYLTNEPLERFTACGGACAGNQKSLQSGTVGIRCCRDFD